MDTKAFEKLILHQMFSEITRNIRAMYCEINLKDYFSPEYKYGYTDALGNIQYAINEIYKDIRDRYYEEV